MPALKFRMKPVVVEAFQMTVRHMDVNSGWPQWLFDAWNKPWYRPGAVSRSQREPLLLALILPCGTQRRIEPNDWILRYADGRLERMDAHEFQETFDLVDEPVFAHV